MSRLHYRCQAMVKSPRRPNVIMRRHIALLLGAGLIAVGLATAQFTPRIKPPKKEKELETQTLPLPPEPPSAVIAETGEAAALLYRPKGCSRNRSAMP